MVSYDMYVELCLQCCLMDDCGDKEKVKKSNRAMDKIKKLQSRMLDYDCTELLGKLLNHEDDRVRLSAGAFGFSNRIMYEKSKQILTDLSCSCKDKMLAFDAKMVLASCIPKEV